MTFYKENVYRVYTEAVASATRSAIAYAKIENLGRDDDGLEEAIGFFDEAFRDFEAHLEVLKAVLPEPAFSKSSLKRHTGWCRYWIDKGNPLGCGNDPHEILNPDLPNVIAEFERWWLESSKIDEAIVLRMAPFGKSDLVTSSIREAWTVFKSEVVDALDVSDELDGVALVRQMFRQDGPLRSALSEKKRRAYCHLLTGLYGLYRNPVMHNDMEPNPAEAEVVVALLGRCLAEVRAAIAKSTETDQSRSTA